MGYGTDFLQILIFSRIPGHHLKGPQNPGLAFHPFQVEYKITFQAAFSPL